MSEDEYLRKIVRELYPGRTAEEIRRIIRARRGSRRAARLVELCAEADTGLTPRGAAIVRGLSAFRDALASGEPIGDRYTVRDVSRDEPPCPPDLPAGPWLAALDLYARMPAIDAESEQEAQVQQDSEAGRHEWCRQVAAVLAEHFILDD